MVEVHCSTCLRMCKTDMSTCLSMCTTVMLGHVGVSHMRWDHHKCDYIIFFRFCARVSHSTLFRTYFGRHINDSSQYT